MSDRFELDRAALFGVLRERGVEDTRNLTLARAVAAWSDDPRYRRESIAVLLAQLTYLLGIAAHVAPRPKEFTPHCLLGLAGSYHGAGEMFMLCLCRPDGPFVCEEHTAAVDLLDSEPAPTGHELIRAVCALLLDHASALIPAARAAADAR